MSPSCFSVSDISLHKWINPGLIFSLKSGSLHFAVFSQSLVQQQRKWPWDGVWCTLVFNSDSSSIGQDRYYPLHATKEESGSPESESELIEVPSTARQTKELASWLPLLSSSSWTRFAIPLFFLWPDSCNVSLHVSGKVFFLDMSERLLAYYIFKSTIQCSKSLTSIFVLLCFCHKHHKIQKINTVILLIK